MGVSGKGAERGGGGADADLHAVSEPGRLEVTPRDRSELVRELEAEQIAASASPRAIEIAP
jgi:hypothetical protein